MDEFVPYEGCEVYEFNRKLPKDRDDGKCVNCRKFLTLECPYIDHFMDEEEDFEEG